MKDDKKKVMILGVLFVVIIGVGAFTMLGGSSTPPPTPKSDKKEDAKTVADKAAADAAAEAPKNPLYAAELSQRDPFEPRTIAGDAPKQSAVNPPPAASPLPNPRGSRRGHSGGGSIGTVPPVSWNGGAIPTANGMQGSIGISPAGPDPSAFGYSVTGTLMGARPVAVFSDSQGNQRMVPVGGSLDGDSKVIAVEKGQVTISHRGKTLRLPLGGNPK